MRVKRSTLLAAIGPAYRGPVRRDDPGGPAGNANNGGAGGGDNGTGGTGDGDGGKPADDDKTPKIDGDFDPERAARAIAAAREAEKKAKERAQNAEQQRQAMLDAVAVALGLKPDPKADPAELVKQAATERDKAVAKAREQAIELAVYKAAGKAGGDPTALLDSRTFLTSLKDLDPDASDFAAKVSDAIKAAVKDNPRLAAPQSSAQGGQGPARQGTAHTGGTGTRQRPTSLGAAIAARLGGSQ